MMMNTKNGIKTNKFPMAFEIQTTNGCNGRCTICPHRYLSKTTTDMTTELFEKIIQQISAFDNKDIRIIPYLNGEPFLDKQFVERLNYIRELCPTVVIEISTNLSRLTKEIVVSLLENEVYDLRISCFGFTEKAYRNVMQGLDFNMFRKNLKFLLDENRKSGKLKKISLTMIQYPGFDLNDYELAEAFCKENGINLNFWEYLDRAGNVPVYSNQIVVTEDDEARKRYTCAQNRETRMHILANGSVVMCCQDWQAQYIMGDANRDDLLAIWNNEKYQSLRNQLEVKGVPYPELCKKCKILLEGFKG